MWKRKNTGDLISGCWGVAWRWGPGRQETAIEESRDPQHCPVQLCPCPKEKTVGVGTCHWPLATRRSSCQKKKLLFCQFLWNTKGVFVLFCFLRKHKQTKSTSSTWASILLKKGKNNKTINKRKLRHTTHTTHNKSFKTRKVQRTKKIAIITFKFLTPLKFLFKLFCLFLRTLEFFFMFWRQITLIHGFVWWYDLQI